MGVSVTRKLLLPMLSWRAVATHANTKKKVAIIDLHSGSWVVQVLCCLETVLVSS